MNSLMKRNPFAPFSANLLDDFFGKDLFDWTDKNFSSAGSTLPSVNVKEADDNFAIEVAAPGFGKEDFKLELDNGVLTVSGERKNEKQSEEKGKYTRKEFNYASFSRSFRLPVEHVEDDRIDAKYLDGILHIVLPKKEAAKPKLAKTIAVK